MKTADILDAIKTLDNAGRSLRCGGSIQEQMQLGLECYRIGATLKVALEREHPECKVLEESER